MGKRSSKRHRPHGHAAKAHAGETPHGDDTRGTWWSRRGAPALLVFAVTLAYANTFQGPFVFDDEPSIVGNPSIRHLGSLRIFAAPPDAVTTTGRPILNATLALNYAIGGLSVGGYHAVNLLIHVLAALTLFGLVRRALALPSLAARFGSSSTGLALAVSLLWALHPLQTESVTYIVQRAESLVGLFYLSTLYAYVRGATVAHGNRWFTAAVAACALGMGSKEVMASAPLLVILFDRLFLSDSIADGWRRRGRVWLALAATWAVLLTAVLSSEGRGGSAGFGLGMSAWSYARTQFGWILHYLRLSLWPHPLVIDYGNSVLSARSNIIPAALGIVLLLAATVAALLRRPMLGFLGVWFFAILAPSSSLVPLAGQTAAEHRMYLPLAAVVVLTVFSIHRIGERLGPLFQRVRLPLFAGVAIVLGITTLARNRDYQSELALWDSAVRNGPPNARGYLNRGNALLDKDQAAAAIADFDQAIRLFPAYAKPYNARGNALVGEGRFDEALRDFDTAVRLKPDFVEAHNGRGSALGNLGQVDAAIAAFSRTIEMDPTHEEAHFNRASALNAKGRHDEAIADFTRALALRPDYPTALQGRALAYLRTGAFDRAWADVATLKKLAAPIPPDLLTALETASGRNR